MSRKWAEALLASTSAPPKPLLDGFANWTLEMASTVGRTDELVAAMIELRAAGSSGTTATVLRALAQDVRAGLHHTTQPDRPLLFHHADGGQYEFLTMVRVRVGDDGWRDGVAYRSTDTSKPSDLYVTDIGRWQERFTPVSTDG